MLYSDDEYKLFAEELEGSSMGTVWSAMRADNFGKEELSYKEKCDYFFELMERLLLEGSIDEQISLYRENFPKNQEEMEEDAFDGFWFLTEKCPGGIVWIHDNGYEDWT